MVRMFKVRIDPIKQQLKLLSNQLWNFSSQYVDESESALKMNVLSLKLLWELYIRLISQTKASIKQI